MKLEVLVLHLLNFDQGWGPGSAFYRLPLPVFLISVSSLGVGFAGLALDSCPVSFVVGSLFRFSSTRCMYPKREVRSLGPGFTGSGFPSIFSTWGPGFFSPDLPRLVRS